MTESTAVSERPIEVDALAEQECPVALEELQEALRQARAGLYLQLKRFGLSVIPTKSDPEGRDFYNDLTALNALKAYRHAVHKLDYFRHKQEILERNYRYRKVHKVEHLADSAAWYRNHPDRAIEIWRKANRKRRVNLAGADGSHTEEEFRELCLAFGNRCAYCLRPEEEVGLLAVDHVIPLDAGGSDYIENILPACKSCNSSKGTRPLEDFLVKLGAVDSSEYIKGVIET